MKCGKCGKKLPASEFYYHAQSSRRDKTCKPCRRAMAKANRAKRIEYYRAYDRARGSRQSLEQIRNYRRTSPAIYKAHNAVNNAIRDGLLMRMECEICGHSQTHAHHDDYLRPLSVRWLCAEHHKAWHARNGAAANCDAPEERVLEEIKKQRAELRKSA